MFEWYDFYLYATLAPFFASLFFPAGKRHRGAAVGASRRTPPGFLVRPFGALLFGRLGDIVGRKYTFLVTILVMGGATFLVGFLPTYAAIGWAAPLLLVVLRLLQGLALGGEYGGAATYVAEHAKSDDRGYATSWIQTTATIGFFLSLARDRPVPSLHGQRRVRRMGLAHSVPGFGRAARVLGLHPAEAQRVTGLPAHEGGGEGLEGAADRSFLRYPNVKYRAARPVRRRRRPVASSGTRASSTRCSSSRSRSRSTMLTAYLLIGGFALIGTPFFVVFGWLSDRIGRLKIIMAGCLIAALTYIPLFGLLTHYANPASRRSSATRHRGFRRPQTCNLHVFVGPWSKFTDCDAPRTS